MSVYKNENPEWFRDAVKSVAEQTVKPDEILIVQDGMLSDELYSMCDKLKDCYSVIRYLKLDKNYGLGMALHYGVKACKNELIARMDTDDIAVENRFELLISSIYLSVFVPGHCPQPHNINSSLMYGPVLPIFFTLTNNLLFDDRVISL